MSSRERARFGKIMLTGILKRCGTANIRVLLEDKNGNVLLCTSDTTTVGPPVGSKGFARGCFCIAESRIFVNQGDPSGWLDRWIANL